jgi:hypothetical protein
MTKMVPASFRVSDASLLPPRSFDFSRANTPMCEADWVSIAATGNPDAMPPDGGDAFVYQPFVKIWLGARHSGARLLARTRNPFLQAFERYNGSRAHRGALSWGRATRGPVGDVRNDELKVRNRFASIQIDIELVSAVRANQRQLQRGTVRIDA